MKKIEKTFWVSDWGMGKILNNDPGTPRFNLEKEGDYVHRVTIIIEKEEKKIELTESMFDDAVKSFFKDNGLLASPMRNGVKIQDHLKLELFGGSND